jgi:predicted  nucleic acid-binding Zn-ribbon protein
MDDMKAIESLTREMELTRHEMAALTDALSRLSNTMQETAAIETRLAELIEERSRQRGFWQRLVG